MQLVPCDPRANVSKELWLNTVTGKPARQQCSHGPSSRFRGAPLAAPLCPLPTLCQELLVTEPGVGLAEPGH